MLHLFVLDFRASNAPLIYQVWDGGGGGGEWLPFLHSLESTRSRVTINDGPPQST
jgi:hypothetical protein